MAKRKRRLRKPTNKARNAKEVRIVQTTINKHHKKKKKKLRVSPQQTVDWDRKMGK